MISYRFKFASSLDKIFPDADPTPQKIVLESFWEETISFQLAYYSDSSGYNLLEDELFFEVKADFDCDIIMRKVMLMPSILAAAGANDEDYLRKTAGLYPDLLRSYSGGIKPLHKQWQSIWIDVTPHEGSAYGEHEIKVIVREQKEVKIWEGSVRAFVYDTKLLPMKFLHTQWLHGDCLADYYKIRVFSTEHWTVLENFIEYGVKHGINVIYTPLFTPPLDTEEGKERTTIQLIGVEKKNGEYQFDFTLLRKWIGICRKHGVKVLEMSHLFTQWGAYHAPKIMATVFGELQQIFGWDSDATGGEYECFLDEFLPKLCAVLKEENYYENTIFHVSDEPRESHLDSYGSAKAILNRYIEKDKIYDACSDYALYSKGAVSCPIVAIDHIEPFIKNDIKGLWSYYCCVQGVDVSNVFFSMPSYRNRILGIQSYLYNLSGFLHWGYNFYNTRWSKKHINPYEITDCGGEFPSGDAFLVYPGENYKPEGSIRLMVLNEAMNDIRAMELLESLVGREYVIKLINDSVDEKITFNQYPRNMEYIIELRRRINREVYKNIKTD